MFNQEIKCDGVYQLSTADGRQDLVFCFVRAVVCCVDNVSPSRTSYCQCSFVISTIRRAYHLQDKERLELCYGISR